MGTYIENVTPDRVLTFKGMTSYEDARDKDVSVEIVFVRDDGWTLGAPGQLGKEAYMLWEANWERFIDRDGNLHEIAEFHTMKPRRKGFLGLY